VLDPILSDLWGQRNRVAVSIYPAVPERANLAPALAGGGEERNYLEESIRTIESGAIDGRQLIEYALARRALGGNHAFARIVIDVPPGCLLGPPQKNLQGDECVVAL
jgi:hypothetical protein